ncbi:hypothetical protein [Rubritalea sp.]|uniref:hypothetical protein n=1 Tax=Rubritalea sp. TaxID=2109375 RepID=UPI003EFADB01
MNKPLFTLSAILALGGISFADVPSQKDIQSKVTQSVAESLHGHTRVLKNGALAPVSISKKADYYFVYYAASW